MMEIAQAAAMQKNFNVWVDGFLACNSGNALCLTDTSRSLRPLCHRITQGCRMVCAAVREDPYAAQPCRRIPHVVSKHSDATP